MAGVVVTFMIDFISTRSLKKNESKPEPVVMDQSSFKPTPSDLSKWEEKKDQAITRIETADDSQKELSVEEKRKHWEVDMLEGGTVFHSFLVGLTVGAQGGSAFVSSLICVPVRQPSLNTRQECDSGSNCLPPRL